MLKPDLLCNPEISIIPSDSDCKSTFSPLNLISWSLLPSVTKHCIWWVELLPGGTNLIDVIYGPVGKLIFYINYPYSFKTAMMPVLSSYAN